MYNCYGEKLTALGTAISIQLAECLSINDILILSALLTAIGDQLALIATTREVCESCCSENSTTIPPVN